MMDNGANKYDGLVKALMITMIALVIFVIIWVILDTCVNLSYKKSLSRKLDQIEYITVDAVEYQDSLNVYQGKYLTGKDIKDLLDHRIETEATIVDSNNYLAIILTLITLCVSLSVVIPYIVGKSVISKDVKDVVEELYQKDRYNAELKEKNNIKMLLASEAHLSRMVSYSLLNNSRFTYPILQTDTYKVDYHPVWAMGWAAKSLIRYITSVTNENAKSYAVFADNLVQYIKDAYAALTSDAGMDLCLIDNKPANRALYDLLNAIAYQKTLCTGLFKDNDQLDAITQITKDLFDKIKAGQEFKNVEVKSLTDKAYTKSHCDAYLDTYTKEVFKEKLKEQVEMLF